MALCLAESLLERERLRCARPDRSATGAGSSEGTCRPPGSASGSRPSTARALALRAMAAQLFSGSHDPRRRTRRPLSRVAPAVMYFFADAAGGRAAGRRGGAHHLPGAARCWRPAGALCAGAARGARRAHPSAAILDRARGRGTSLAAGAGPGRARVSGPAVLCRPRSGLFAAHRQFPRRGAGGREPGRQLGRRHGRRAGRSPARTTACRRHPRFVAQQLEKRNLHRALRRPAAGPRDALLEVSAATQGAGRHERPRVVSSRRPSSTPPARVPDTRHGRFIPSSARPARAALPWTRLSDEELLKMRFCDLQLSIERSPLAARMCAACTRNSSDAASHFRPHVWLGGGMVLARRRAGHRGAVLSGASAARAARAAHHARGGGRQCALADAHPAPRGRPRPRQRLPPAPAQALARGVRACLAAVSGAATARAPAAAATCITWASGTRRRIPPRISPRPSRCG